MWLCDLDEYRPGRAACVLDEGEDGTRFSGSPTAAAVLEQATHAEPAERHASIAAFDGAWRQAVAGDHRSY